ncbi:hypothetical protein [Paracoccus sp. JM45]|nr:hypothetical protein [Paracoccus sp. JM45]
MSHICFRIKYEMNEIPSGLDVGDVSGRMLAHPTCRKPLLQQI